MWGPQVDIGWLHLLIPAGHLALGIPSKPPECHDRRRPPLHLWSFDTDLGGPNSGPHPSRGSGLSSQGYGKWEF